MTTVETKAASVIPDPIARGVLLAPPTPDPFPRSGGRGDRVGRDLPPPLRGRAGEGAVAWRTLYGNHARPFSEEAAS